MSENPYSVNETMKLLGKQYPTKIITDEIFNQIKDIVAVRMCGFEAAFDIFSLGYIYGKHNERARKKVGQHNGKIY